MKAYLYDPTGDKARAVKRRYQGLCRGCGAPTSARNGTGDAYAYCARCRPGAAAPRRSPEWVREAMHDWQRRYGRLPSSTDWSRPHARRRDGEALRRLADRDWPSPSTVVDLYGSWAAARADALNASMSEAPGPRATQTPATPKQPERAMSPPWVCAASHTLVDATPRQIDRARAREVTATTTATGGWRCTDQR